MGIISKSNLNYLKSRKFARKHKLPHIKIKKRRKYCELSVDFTTTGNKTRKKLNQNSKKLINKIQNNCCDFLKYEPIFNPSGFECFKVPVNGVKYLAQKIIAVYGRVAERDFKTELWLVINDD